MPYIKQEWRELLKSGLDSLAEGIKEIGKINTETPLGRLPVYRYVCEKLALKIMPEKRYATLSATRAIFFDAADEWSRRMSVEIGKVVFTDTAFSILDQKIAGLVMFIKILLAANENYNLAYPGILNYCFTILGLKIMDDKKDKQMAKGIAGTLECIGFEFYETQMAPYEDEQIAKNGDVYPEIRG